MVRYSTVQYSTVQYSTVQYITLHYITVQYSTVQHSTAQYMLVLLIYEPVQKSSLALFENTSLLTSCQHDIATLWWTLCTYGITWPFALAQYYLWFETYRACATSGSSVAKILSVLFARSTFLRFVFHDFNHFIMMSSFPLNNNNAWLLKLTI